ncbi:hypothetical protein GCK72_021148 [Caenorhabditis remanei]|uniref:Uncharacterized protein n=1 Tax=Caenorhabditis remanei TaxID=31234 RepID=A0A6A5GJ41_CAERE|nr:hypothetical protein GCK72_021148 [Caenorhabditis remanei]KAF1754585.1 hypothetical protein GCK72_021148 [Caenorhabditis remanei]
MFYLSNSRYFSWLTKPRGFLDNFYKTLSDILNHIRCQSEILLIKMVTGEDSKRGKWKFFNDFLEEVMNRVGAAGDLPTFSQSTFPSANHLSKVAQQFSFSSSFYAHQPAYPHYTFRIQLYKSFDMDPRRHLASCAITLMLRYISLLSKNQPIDEREGYTPEIYRHRYASQTGILKVWKAWSSLSLNFL